MLPAGRTGEASASVSPRRRARYATSATEVGSTIVRVHGSMSRRPCLLGPQEHRGDERSPRVMPVYEPFRAETPHLSRCRPGVKPRDTEKGAPELRLHRRIFADLRRAPEYGIVAEAQPVFADLVGRGGLSVDAVERGDRIPISHFPMLREAQPDLPVFTPFDGRLKASNLSERVRAVNRPRRARVRTPGEDEAVCVQTGHYPRRGGGRRRERLRIELQRLVRGDAAVSAGNQS